MVKYISPVNILLVSKTSSRHLQDMSLRRLQDMSSRRLQDMSSRRLLRHNFLSSKTSSRRLEDVFKTCLQDVFKTSSRPANVCWVCLLIKIIFVVLIIKRRLQGKQISLANIYIYIYC